MTATKRDTLDGIRRSLQTIESEDPRELRRIVLDAVQRAVGADAVTFLRYDLRAGERYYAGPMATSEAVDAVYARFDGRAALPNPYDHLRPDPRELNRFVDKRTFLFDGPLPEDHPMQREVYGPLGVADEQRALCFDGRRFIARLSTVFHEANRVTPAMTADLNRLMPELHALLVRADRLERAELAAPAFFLVRADGAVDHASVAGAAWLDPERRKQMAALVRAADASPLHSVLHSIDGVRATLMRMHGSAVMYLVTLEASQAPELSPEHVLTARQREIADYAIAGATGREIAEALGVGHETVREHLKEIYRRLGIGSRVELVHLLKPGG